MGRLTKVFVLLAIVIVTVDNKVLCASTTVPTTSPAATSPTTTPPTATSPTATSSTTTSPTTTPATSTPVTATPTTTTPTPPLVCNGKHEVVSTRCNNPCNYRTCANEENPGRICTQVCGLEPFCDCAVGYYRNSCGACVPKLACKLPCKNTTVCLKPNQVPVDCWSPCTARTCANRNASPGGGCAGSGVCAPGHCDCQNGFSENECGDCVPSEDCDLTCDQNVSCGPNEEHNSNNVCVCVRNYKRNSCNQCVPFLRVLLPCDHTNPCTQKNEVFRCFNSCTERTCANINDGILKRCTSNCTAGCDCNDGYRRNKLGQCIPEGLCPIKLF